MVGTLGLEGYFSCDHRGKNFHAVVWKANFLLCGIHHFLFAILWWAAQLVLLLLIFIARNFPGYVMA